MIISDELDDFITTAAPRNDNFDDESDDDSVTNDITTIPTTYTGQIAVEVQEKTSYRFKCSGCNVLNNAGSLLTRKTYDIKVSNYLKHHIQTFVSAVHCLMIPLLYLEAMLFPSNLWKDAYDNCSIVGAIPSSLFN